MFTEINANVVNLGELTNFKVYIEREISLFPEIRNILRRFNNEKSNTIF